MTYLASDPLTLTDVATWVGALIAIPTLCILINQELRAKRRVNGPKWSLWSSASYTDNGKLIKIVTLDNSGIETASITGLCIIGGRLTPNTEFVWTYPGGRAEKFEIETNEPDDVWCLLLWSSTTDKRFVFAYWLPLTASGKLADEHARQVSERGVPRLLWLRDYLDKGRAVGPSGICGRRIKIKIGKTNVDEPNEEIVKVLEIVTKEKGVTYMRP